MAAGRAGAPAAPPATGAAGTHGRGPRGRPRGAIAAGPIVRDGVLFYTLGMNAYAIDGRTGRQLWHYVARSSGGLSNRGLAIAGDTIFMMANGGLTALDVATGAERWVKELGGPVPATAPFVVRDHVYVGVGSDAGVVAILARVAKCATPANASGSGTPSRRKESSGSTRGRRRKKPVAGKALRGRRRRTTRNRTC